MSQFTGPSNLEYVDVTVLESEPLPNYKFHLTACVVYTENTYVYIPLGLLIKIVTQLASRSDRRCSWVTSIRYLSRQGLTKMVILREI